MERETLTRLRERWLADLFCSGRDAVWVVLVALTLGLGSGLFRLDLRTDGAAIHPSGQRHRAADPGRPRHVPRRRPGDRAADVAARRAGARVPGPSLESDRGFERIARLQRALESLPSVDGARVRSLATLLDPDPTLAITDIEPFLDHVPSSLADDPAWIAAPARIPADARAVPLRFRRGGRVLRARGGGPQPRRVHQRSRNLGRLESRRRLRPAPDGPGGCRSDAGKSRAARPAVAGADHGRGDRAVALPLAANPRRRRDSAGGSR